MNPSPRPGRRSDEQPTIAEITALTRRLRELSTPGRHVDEGERAAFLAEKDALLARIADPHDGSADEQGRQLHTHRPQLDRVTAGPFDEHTNLDENEWHPGGSARLDLPHPDALTPVAQQRRAEPDELTARVAALHQQLAAEGQTAVLSDIHDDATDAAADVGWAR